MFYTDFGCTTTEDFCVTYLVFSFVDFFSFALSLSFLDSLYFATLELSFSLSLLSLCFFLRWPSIAASPGCQAEKGGGGGPLRLLPSSADPVSDCDMILKTRCKLYICPHEKTIMLFTLTSYTINH